LFAKDIYKTKFKLGNEKVYFHIEGAPTGLNKEDQEFKGKLKSDWNTSSGLWEGTAAVKYGSPLMGPLRLWFTTDVAWKNTKQTTIKPTINFALKDLFDFGVSAEHDLTDLNKLSIVLKKKIGDEKTIKAGFLKFDVKDKKYGLGADFKCIKSDASAGLDIEFDGSDAKPEHFLGHPVVAKL